MTFRILAYVMTVAGTVLGLRFILAGASVLREWNIETTPGAVIICRRLGALYLGLALMFFLGRNAGASDLRSAACLGVGGASGLLAALGLFEWWSRRVGTGIVVPAIVEIGLAAAFGWVSWSGR
jgi:hypothetical protein